MPNRPTQESKWQVIAHPGNGRLLVALTLLILLQPAVPGAWILFLHLGAMALAVWQLQGTRATTRAVLTFLTLPCLALLIIPNAPNEDALANRWTFFEITVSVAIVLFLLYACYVLLCVLLRARSVSMETIFGAIDIYIVVGLVWSFIYAIHEWAIPGSFHLPLQAGAAPSLATFTYYSFVTQATQGYGDIVPVHSFARALVILHTIIGQFYVAIVIAYFLGLYVAQGRVKPSDSGNHADR